MRGDPTLSVKAYEYRFGRANAVAIEPAVAVETPVNLIYGTIPYAVMMASPADLEDFAFGFSLTEAIIEAPSDIRSVKIETESKGIRLLIDLVPERLHRHLSRVRNIAGRTACGLCGIEDLDSLPQAQPVTGPAGKLPLAAVRTALGLLENEQHLNRLTRSVHGAAWFTLSGALVALREDVGRHNALDKLIGHLMRLNLSPADGFTVITSRCSYEMVEKTAMWGSRILVAVSAPTSLAIERARALNLTLIAIARGDGATSFTGHELLIFDPLLVEARRGLKRS